MAEKNKLCTLQTHPRITDRITIEWLTICSLNIFIKTCATY